MKPSIETCLSPSLLHLYDLRERIVVIIDVFRATSTMAAALEQGAHCIIPVDKVDTCIELGLSTPNSVTAGERDGQVAQGLQHGNSPLEYPRSFIENKTLNFINLLFVTAQKIDFWSENVKVKSKLFTNIPTDNIKNLFAD